MDTQEKSIHLVNSFVVKEHRPDGGLIDITTSDVDRAQDRVFTAGINLVNYLKNPVVLWGHNSQDAWSLIGNTRALTTTSSVMTADFMLREAANQNDQQNIIRLLWDVGWVKAASIQFRVDQFNMDDENPPVIPNEFGGLDFIRTQLLEWSLLPLPDNQNALRRAFSGVAQYGKRITECIAGEFCGGVFPAQALEKELSNAAKGTKNYNINLSLSEDTMPTEEIEKEVTTELPTEDNEVTERLTKQETDIAEISQSIEKTANTMESLVNKLEALELRLTEIVEVKTVEEVPVEVPETITVDEAIIETSEPVVVKELVLEEQETTEDFNLLSITKAFNDDSITNEQATILTKAYSPDLTKDETEQLFTKAGRSISKKNLNSIVKAEELSSQLKEILASLIESAEVMEPVKESPEPTKEESLEEAIDKDVEETKLIMPAFIMEFTN